MKIWELAEKYHFKEAEKNRLKEYISNKFADAKQLQNTDEAFLEKWQKIIACAKTSSAAQALNQYVCAKRPVEFEQANEIKLELYQSFSGQIPVIYIKNPNDFEAFLTNAIYKGIRPDNISETGASFAYGKKTRFITLSAKPYSNIPASEIGISDEEWKEKSMIIRREHECTHYYTKCHYGLSENNLHDEIMADFFGLYEAFGNFRAEYFLKFMGIIGKYGNRLAFYVNGFDERSVNFIKEVAEEAAKNLELWSKSGHFRRLSRSERVDCLCLSGLQKIFEGEIS